MHQRGRALRDRGNRREAVLWFRRAATLGHAEAQLSLAHLLEQTAETRSRLEEAVNWIRAANGIAVIAHPARYQLSGARLRQLLSAFRDCGGVGIEVVSGSHSNNDIQRFTDLADYFGLYSSRGSDYHGPEASYMDPTRLPDLPDICRPVWTHSDWYAAMR